MATAGFKSLIAELKKVEVEPPIEPTLSKPKKELSEQEKWEQSVNSEVDKAGILKAPLEPGHGSDTPKSGDLVWLHLTIASENGRELFSTRPQAEGGGDPLRFVLGKNTIVRGLEISVPFMKKGERAVLKVPPEYAYAAAGSQHPPIPDDAPRGDAMLFDVTLVDWTSDVKVITEDGLVFKQVLSEGNGWEQPRADYEVQLRIAGRGPDGEVFFSSDKCKGGVLRYVVGKQQVPEELELAVKEMLVGESASIVMRAPRINPGGAIAQVPAGVPSVEYKVELLDMTQVRDLVGNGKVIKRRLRTGEGMFPVDCPVEDCTVTIRYKGTLADGTVFYDGWRDKGGEPIVVDTGQGLLPEGLDMAVRLMCRKELASVTAEAEYAYDKFPSRPADVPDGASVAWEVELLDFEAAKNWNRIDFGEQMADALAAKEQGNRVFGRGDYALAAQKYRKLIQKLDRVRGDTPEEAAQVDAIKLPCMLNLAACCVKTDDFGEAIKMCSRVIDYDPMNAKAYYRRGTAFMSMGDFENASIDFKQMALCDDSYKKDSAAALATLARKQEAHKRQEKNLFGGMFSRSAVH
eukprot:jgi/Mesvir1/5322/Mv15413-RA.1